MSHFSVNEGSPGSSLRSRASRILALAAALGCLFAEGSVQAAPFVLAYTDTQIGQSYTNLQAYYKNISAVGLGSAYSILASGKIDTSGVTSTNNNIIAFAKKQGLPLYPTVSDYSNATGDF